MADRWAVILKSNTDGVAEVIDVKLMEGVPPEANADIADRYEYRKSDTLRIGMVAGGPVESVDGFGFAQGREPSSSPGATRIADTQPDEASLPATSHDKVRVGENGAVASNEQPAAPEENSGTASKKSSRKKAA